MSKCTARNGLCTLTSRRSGFHKHGLVVLEHGPYNLIGSIQCWHNQNDNFEQLTKAVYFAQLTVNSCPNSLPMMLSTNVCANWCGHHGEIQTSGNTKHFIGQYTTTWFVFSVKRGRVEVLQVYNQEEEISTPFRWLNDVSMFDSPKLCFRRTKWQACNILSTFQQAQDHRKHATKGGQRLQVGEGQEETKRQIQLRLLLLARRWTDRMYCRCLV